MKKIFNGKTIFSVLAVLSATGFNANAANTESYDIKLEAKIPSEGFYVRPVDSSWTNEVQEMEYDIGTKTLKPVTKQFGFKNDGGSIKATLTDAVNSNGKSQLFNGNTAIPLTVKFNNVEVDSTGKTVVSETEAKTGGRTNLVISAEKNSDLTTAGDYTGTVSIVFDAESSSGTGS